MPVGLDTAIIPSIPNNRTEIRRALKIDEHAPGVHLCGPP